MIHRMLGCCLRRPLLGPTDVDDVTDGETGLPTSLNCSLRKECSPDRLPLIPDLFGIRGSAR